MGIFNRYLKEGPGVDKDAPKKKGIFLFAELVGRKFFILIKANLLYSLVSIPFFAVSLFFLAPWVRSAIFQNVAMGNIEMAMLNIFFAGLIFNFFGSGPASAAYAYVTRSFTRSEPVWVASDGFDVFKENFKYSILLVVIDIIVIFLASYAICFYGASTDSFSAFLRVFIIVLLVIYAMAHTFIYQIIVTYDCKFREVIKYSIIMAVAKLPMCILLAILTSVLYSVIWYLPTIIAIIIYLIVGLTFTRYPLEFYATRVIEKNIAKTQPEEETDNGDEE